MINILGGVHSLPLTVEKRNKPIHYFITEVYSIDLTAWYYDIYQYLMKKEYPPASFLKSQQA